MLRIGLNGACGKMGLKLVNLIYQQPDLKLTLALERPDHPALGKDIVSIAGLDVTTEVTVSNNIPEKICDVILDFSSPLATMSCVDGCKKYKIALVVGTTGLNPRQLSKVKEASKKIPVLISPNFSQGANLLGRLGCEVINRLGKKVDIEIVETHHCTKRDAPSGTALKLAQELKTVIKNKEIPIHSLRIGQVVGEHKIVLGIPGERIELIHQVDNRDAFVYGALKAARILVLKSPGYYTLDKIFTE